MLLGSVLTMLFATVIFSTTYRFYALSDPKDVLFLFATSMLAGWVIQRLFVFAVLKGKRKKKEN